MLCNAAAGYDNKSTFPIILKVPKGVELRKSIAKGTGNVLGNLAFPEYSGAVEAVSEWLASQKVEEIHVKISITPEFITFTPNDLGEQVLFKGLKSATISTPNVTDIYDLPHTSTVIATRNGNYVVRIDSDSHDWFIQDALDLVRSPSTAGGPSALTKAYKDLIDELVRVCPRAHLHR
jgi:hypothetical protein